MTGWRWDETLFAGAAAHYASGRLPYAPGWVDAVAELIGADGHGRLLDVGCGPGTLSIPLAPWFDEVIGLDPDADMIAVAAARAAAGGPVGRCRWVHQRAEQLPAGLGSFAVVSFGQSFHWLDRDRVAATVHAMLDPGGAVVHVSDVKATSPPAAVGPHPPVPYDDIRRLVQRHLGPDRRAGRGVLPGGTPSGEDEVFARAGFSAPQRQIVPGGQALERSVDTVVAEVFSMSFSAPPLFGVHRPRFEGELRRLLDDATPSGRFSQAQPATEIRVWRR